MAVAAAGYHISVKLTTLATQIGTASERISSIGSNVSLTSSALQQLGELMKQQGTYDGVSIFSQSSLETTRISATTCQNIFKELEQAVQSASEQIRGKRKLVAERIELSKLERLKWPFLHPKISCFQKRATQGQGNTGADVTSCVFILLEEGGRAVGLSKIGTNFGCFTIWSLESPFYVSNSD